MIIGITYVKELEEMGGKKRYIYIIKNENKMSQNKKIYAN